YVDDLAARFRSGKAVAAHSFEVGHASAVVDRALLNHDRVSHVVRSWNRALRCYRCIRGTAGMKDALSNEQLEPLICEIRDQRVILDADLARIYGVSTRVFNQAFKRNQDRFPADFAFQITPAELDNLRSQSVISSSQQPDSARDNWSQTVTSSHGGRRYLPWAFTEHGALMAANILRSERAVQMSVFVVRAFIRLREQIATNTSVVVRLADIEKRLLRHDQELLDLYLKLQAL